MDRRKWTDDQCLEAIKNSRSLRQVLFALGLREAGGNYQQIKDFIAHRGIDVSHMKGRSWNKGMVGVLRYPRKPLSEILVRDSHFQSHKLKKKLFESGLKNMECEVCRWAKKSPDGRLPLELHHRNGDSTDNRIENLQILCPNCHSLMPNYRGNNTGEWRNRYTRST